MTTQSKATLAGPTLAGLGDDLACGRTTARALVDGCLARIDDPAGEGQRVFMHVARDAAIATADAIDQLRSSGAEPSRYAGIPVAIKDLFDIRGQVTRAGSKVLADRPPATADAVAVARLRAAGFIVIGRANMTEFAFSGVGLNPHFGTPKSPWDRTGGRIPGGSSSGSAVAVSDGMAHAGLGTDTGGSCRIPAAFCGLVGFKPTARRVPTDGAVPLSTTLDSVGPMARTVSCCAILDQVLAGEPIRPLTPAPLAGLRLAVPQNIMLAGMDAHVAKAFERTLSRLSAAGAHVAPLQIPELDDLPRINAKGGFSAPEALAWHARWIERGAALYDPRVLVRIRRGQEQTGVDYVELVIARRNLIAAVETRTRDFDALVMPTTPIIPPRIDELASDGDYARINGLALRNPSVINMLDGCAISLPMQTADEPPMGLMLAASSGRDHALMRIAASVEALLAKA